MNCVNIPCHLIDINIKCREGKKRPKNIKNLPCSLFNSDTETEAGKDAANELEVVTEECSGIF